MSPYYYSPAKSDAGKYDPTRKKEDGGGMTPALPQLSYTEVKIVIDALAEKVDRYESLASRTADPIEKAMIQNHAQRHRALMQRFKQLPTMPLGSQKEKPPKPSI
jgi:hypothetical protein